jgi:hypothetical protein
VGLTRGKARWTPIRVNWEESAPSIDWCRTDGIEFIDPFFEQTVQGALKNPFRLLFRQETPMVALADPHLVHDAIEPSGFVLHMSRCGSTLITQMLGALAEVLVMSEPGPIDGVLRAGIRYPDVPDETWVRYLREMVRALGQRGHPEQRHYIVKLDAWAVVWLPLLRRAFPDTPWVFVYRDPLEVMVSQARQPWDHLIPGVLPAAELGLDLRVGPGPITAWTWDGFGAAVLARVLQEAVRHIDDGPGLLVDYDELPGAVVTRIGPWFGIEPHLLRHPRLVQAASRNAKNPAVAFQDDRVDKQQAATPELRRATELLAPLHAELQARRQRAG